MTRIVLAGIVAAGLAAVYIALFMQALACAPVERYPDELETADYV